MSTRTEDDRATPEVGGVEALALPHVPEDLGVDPLLLALLHTTAFLDFSDDDAVEPEAANEALERVEQYIQRLSEDRLSTIQADLDRLEEYASDAGWPEDMVDFVRDFLYNCGIGDDDEASLPEGEDD
ncbi:hypothetical protein ACFL5O_00485 [Myxococcota bacterium]